MGQGKQGPVGDEGEKGLRGKDVAIEGNTNKLLEQLILDKKFIEKVGNNMNNDVDFIKSMSNSFMDNTDFKNYMFKTILEKAARISYLDRLNLLWCEYPKGSCVTPYNHIIRLKQSGGLIVGNDLKAQQNIYMIEPELKVERKDPIENRVRMYDNCTIKFGESEVLNCNEKNKPIINNDNKFKNILIDSDLKTNTLKVNSLNMSGIWTLSMDNNKLKISSNEGTIFLDKGGDITK